MSLVQPQNHEIISDVLPPELLSHIFILCLPEDERASPNLSTAPLSLTTVCMPWRSVALDTPKLWSSLHIKLLSADWPSTLQAALKTWVSRAGPYALSLGVSWDIKSDWRWENLLGIIDRFLTYVPRCRSFSVRLQHFAEHPIQLRRALPLDSLAHLPREHLPLLQEFEIEQPCLEQERFVEAFLRNAPNLRAISISGIRPCHNLVKLGASLSPLTKLRLNTPESVGDCKEILRLATKLEQCRLDLRTSDDSRRDQMLGGQQSFPPQRLMNPVTQEKLWKLYVGPTNLAAFFDAVTLPALVELSINGRLEGAYQELDAEEESDVDDDDDDLVPRAYGARWNTDKFLTFVHRSMCSLTRLSLFEVHMTSYDLYQCLRALSATLVELHMEGGQCDMVSAGVLHALIYVPPVPLKRATKKAESSGKNKRKKRKGAVLYPRLKIVSYLERPVLCPNLERFRARGYIFDKSCPRCSIVDMIESRYYQSFPLPDLKQLKWVYIGGQFDAEDWARIEKLKKKGLELLVVEEGNWYKPRYIDDPASFE